MKLTIKTDYKQSDIFQLFISVLWTPKSLCSHNAILNNFLLEVEWKEKVW